MSDLTIFFLLSFTCVVLLVLALFSWYNSTRSPEVKKLQRRLQSLSAGGTAEKTELSIIKQRLLSEIPAVEQILLRLPRIHELDKFLVQSGTGFTVTKLVVTSAIGALLGYVLGVWQLSTLWFGGLVLAAAFSAAPFFWVSWRRNKRVLRLQAQLPDALDMITRALRAGHAFSSALKMAGEELEEPLASEFRSTNDEINFGISLHDALTNLAERVPSPDLRFFVVAVLTQRESGGNLTEILTNLSKLIRQRFKLLLKVRTLSADGKLSAWVLCLMPFALTALMNFANPEFISVLWTDPAGLMIVKIVLTLMVIGALIMRKIIKIRV